MANEEQEFQPFIDVLAAVLTGIGCGKVFLVIDNVSKDRTFELAQELSARDNRFITIWAPENRNVVDAYLRGYSEALKDGADIIVEMDAGLSHDPRALPMFLSVLSEGKECVFGSRFVEGGKIYDSSWQRVFLSWFGTQLANVLLATSLRDMTSGFQGFQAGVVQKFLEYPLLSKAHFYQTELRYLLRNKSYTEVPIHYRAPSPSISRSAIFNSISVLGYYLLQRLRGRALYIK